MVSKIEDYLSVVFLIYLVMWFGSVAISISELLFGIHEMTPAKYLAAGTTLMAVIMGGILLISFGWRFAAVLIGFATIAGLFWQVVFRIVGVT